MLCATYTSTVQPYAYGTEKHTICEQYVPYAYGMKYTYDTQQPISHHITPLIINALRVGHRHTDTYRHANQSNFKKPSTHSRRLRVPGLKI